MELNVFPNNPSEGDTVTVNGILYKYTSGVWNVVSKVKTNLREIIKRQATEAGFNLVDGSFEEGAVISGWPDVVWCQADGKYYQWKADVAKTVTAGSSPTNIGTDWIDKSDYSLRSELSIVSIKSYLLVSASTSDAFIAAAAAAGEGGIVRLPSGEYTVTPNMTVTPVRFIGDGQGSTIVKIDNTTPNLTAFTTSAPTKQNIEFGAEHITFQAINGNGLYLFDNPRSTSLNSLRPKVTYKHISLCGTDTASTSDSFAQNYGWKFAFHLGDSWCLTMDGIDHCGIFLPESDPSSQTLDGFIRSNPSGGILSGRVRNITTHNVANFFELVQKTYISFDSVDVARAYRGIYDADDRVYETNAYSYGEAVWRNLIINAQLSCIDLTNRYDLIINGLILHRAKGYDSGVEWKGLRLVKAVGTDINGLEISSNTSATLAQQIGIEIDGGSANRISGLKSGTLGTVARVGITSSANGAAQAVNISDIQLMADVATVIDAQNARNSRFRDFSKSSAYSYTTFVTFGDTTTQNSCYFSNCPTKWTLYGADTGLIINDSAATNEKLLMIDNSDGLTIATRTDSNGAGNNALIMTRTGTTVDKMELRANSSTGYVLLNASNIQFSNYIKPTSDNVYTNGSASYRWSVVYAGTSSISTSDETEKTFCDPELSDAVLDVWASINWRAFKFNDAIEKKGIDTARVHFGLGAQTVKKAFEDAGLDAFKYGLLCYDEWEAKAEELDENGVVISPALEAGSRYGIRYEEALALEAALIRRTTKRLEARLSALEAK